MDNSTKNKVLLEVRKLIEIKSVYSQTAIGNIGFNNSKDEILPYLNTKIMDLLKSVYGKE